MRAHKISIKNKLFLIILLILIVNSLVLLLAGSTLFENFYLYNKQTELFTSAQIVKECYLDGADDWYRLLENIEDKNIVVAVFLTMRRPSRHSISTIPARNTTKNGKRTGAKNGAATAAGASRYSGHGL